MKEGDKPFTLYWLTGERQVVYGRDPVDAMRLARYGGGTALRELPA